MSCQENMPIISFLILLSKVKYKNVIKLYTIRLGETMIKTGITNLNNNNNKHLIIWYKNVERTENVKSERFP